MTVISSFEENPSHWPYMLEYQDLDGQLWDQQVLWTTKLLDEPGADEEHTRWTWTCVRSLDNKVDARIWFRRKEDALLFDLVFDRGR